MFDFVHFESFPTTGGFLRAANRKNEAVLNDFFEMVNLNEIFYAMKIVGKILRGISLIGRIVNFHFHQFLEFSTRGLEVISGFPENTYFSGVYPAKFENLQ